MISLETGPQMRSMKRSYLQTPGMKRNKPFLMALLKVPLMSDVLLLPL